MKRDADDLGLTHGFVRLVDASPRWTALFAEEESCLRAALGPLDAVIDHCGSTSVPRIAAKPIIDILVGVPAPFDLAGIAERLAPLGYEHAAWARVPGHEVFGKGNPRTHLLHLVPKGGEAWQRMLRFRDALRDDAALAARYVRLKQELAARFPEDRAAYTAAKADFIQDVLTGPGPQR